MDEHTSTDTVQESSNPTLHVEAPTDCDFNLTPVQIQQQYFENLGDCNWIRYEKCNRNHLLQNLAFGLFGPPITEGELIEKEEMNAINLQGYTSRQKEKVDLVYAKICEQGKYSFEDEIYMSNLLVVCARPKPKNFLNIQPSKCWIDLHERSDSEIWLVPVFCIRKCIPIEMNAKPCKIYIDDNARVYHSWNAYLTENTLDKCVLIVPENGEYTGTLTEDGTDFTVNLTVAPSPALGLKSRVLSTVDTATTVVSLSAVGVVGVAALTPVAPVLLASAAAVSVTAGIYGLIRSSLHLHDRRTHEQTINVTNSEARNSWLNIAASGVGLTAGAASNLLSKSAAAGTNLTTSGRFLTKSVDVLRHANPLTGAASFTNGFVYLIIQYRKHGQKPSRIEIFQFAMSTLFFFNAVVSNQTAQEIIEQSQANKINEFRDTLRSNRHRKIFDKLSAEARRVRGTVQGNTEVIQGIKNIANKDEYFAQVLSINKDVNQHRLRISMTADGRVMLNNQHGYNPSELHSLGSEGRSQIFTEIGPAPPGPANVSTRLNSPVNRVDNYFGVDDEEGHLLVGIRPEEILQIGTYFVRISSSGTDEIVSMLQNLSEEVYTNLMTLSFNLLSKLVPSEIANLKLLDPERDLISQVVEFVFNYMKQRRPFGEARHDDDGIVEVVKDFFHDGRVNQDTILRLKKDLIEWLDAEITRKNELNPNKKSLICNLCKGVRYA